MISKERLEELIEQGATVYESDFLGVNAINVKKGDYVEQNGTLHTKEFAGAYDYFYNEKLFETKEEAEWHREFGCIERTERLVLPTWEELQNKREFYLGFNNKEGIVRYYLAIDMPYQKDYGAILISYSDANNDTIICFDKIATKENYTLACRKCKELFL